MDDVAADDLSTARQAAQRGAAAIRELAGGIDGAQWKSSDVDPVTEADLASERAILSVLASQRPDDAVLSEEDPGRVVAPGRQWVIDPLDGTVNFLHNFPHVGVSVALVDAGVPRVGVVVDVFRDQEYWAVAGAGAFRDGVRLQVGSRSLDSSLVATGFPYDRRQRAQIYTDRLARVLGQVRGVRRLGAATLDLAWVASGELDAYWETNLGPWDMAAGMLLVEEAGGHVTNEVGRRTQLDDLAVIAGGPNVHSQLMVLVADALEQERDQPGSNAG